VRNKATAGAWTVGTVALFLCVMFSFSQIPVEFFLKSDQRNFSVNVELPPTTTLTASQVVADDVGDFATGGDEEDLEIRLSTAWSSREGRVGGPTRRDEQLPTGGNASATSSSAGSC
jgi:multidrug efflux pump subunit AcrB